MQGCRTFPYNDLVLQIRGRSEQLCRATSPSQSETWRFLSHSKAGKTSLSEAILFNAGHTTRLGRVEDGNTTSDYEPEEVNRGGSIQLTLLPYEWNDTKVNLIDTPGYADFFGRW